MRAILDKQIISIDYATRSAKDKRRKVIKIVVRYVYDRGEHRRAYEFPLNFNLHELSEKDIPLEIEI